MHPSKCPKASVEQLYDVICTPDPSSRIIMPLLFRATSPTNRLARSTKSGRWQKKTVTYVVRNTNFFIQN